MGYRQERGIPDLGVGAGLRKRHVAEVIRDSPEMAWFEVISENHFADGGAQRATIESLRSRYPLVPHGVSLSIGGADPIDADYLRRLKVLVRRVNAPWCSDHLCWTGIAGVDTHDLMPLPFTRDTLRHVVERVKQVQGELGTPLALENPSSYLTYCESSVPEHEFLAEVAERADCGILLDVNNVFVSAHNHGLDANAYIDAIPADRVVQIHLAGHEDRGRYLLDTHSTAVSEPVWALYRRAIGHFGAVSTLVEWDQDVPTWERLAQEVERARTVRQEVLQARAAGPGAQWQPRP
jgi:uncharacterized protein (UPF0276 family)